MANYKNLSYKFIIFHSNHIGFNPQLHLHRHRLVRNPSLVRIVSPKSNLLSRPIFLGPPRKSNFQLIFIIFFFEKLKNRSKHTFLMFSNDSIIILAFSTPKPNVCHLQIFKNLKIHCFRTVFKDQKKCPNSFLMYFNTVLTV